MNYSLFFNTVMATVTWALVITVCRKIQLYEATVANCYCYTSDRNVQLWLVHIALSGVS